MDRTIIDQKLESLRRCVQRVEEKRPSDARQLDNNPDLQDILVLNLTRAVQVCVDIGSHIISASEHTAPLTMGGIFSALADLGVITAETGEVMKKAVGFRNIAVHNYQQISWDIVFAISRNAPEDMRLFAREVDRYLHQAG